jgi:hypothetical protein
MSWDIRIRVEMIVKMGREDRVLGGVRCCGTPTVRAAASVERVMLSCTIVTGSVSPGNLCRSSL